MSENKKETNEEKKVRRILLAAKELPNGAFVKIEQSDTLNVRVTLGKGDKQEVVVITPLVAKTLHGMLGMCLDK